MKKHESKLFNTVGEKKTKKRKPKRDFKWFDTVGGEKTWCYVDTDNVFEYKGQKYRIDKKVKQYKVINKAFKDAYGNMNNWTNEAEMIEILVVDNDSYLRFFDEELNEINHNLILPVANKGWGRSTNYGKSKAKQGQE